MSKTDLVLLHAPHVYDFRKITQLYGPVSDLVLSTPVFEMYPVGLSSITEYAERNGFKVRLVNLAWRMLRDASFDVEGFIRKLDAPLFGIDLHWMVHAHGSVEIAKIVKKYHPGSKTVIGGYSASCYYDELIRYPEVDFVIRGDSAEEPVRALLSALKTGDYSSVPNLVWKGAGSEVHKNTVSCVPYRLDDVMTDHYSVMIKQVLRYHDLHSVVPFKGWLKYPVTAVFTCRGCVYGCVFCAGSREGQKLMTGRERPAFRTPHEIVKDIRNISSFSHAPILVVGDIRQSGNANARLLLDLLADVKVKNTIMFELFNPAPQEFIEAMGRAAPGFSLDISPESHDEEIRRLSLNRFYSNQELEATISSALGAGASRVEVFFMIGLPKQDRGSVLATVNYCEYLLKKFSANKRLFLFIGHQAPFLTPGSPAFNNPEKIGFKLRFKTLEEHRRALTLPSWRYSLNYETEWLSHDEITEVTYEAIARLTALKAKYGQMPQQEADHQLRRIEKAKGLEARIDEIVKNGNLDDLRQLKPEIDAVNGFRAAERLELEIPIGLIRLRYLNAALRALSGRKPRSPK
jgi:B12-binding domain/radical SAM domain protein